MALNPFTGIEDAQPRAARQRNAQGTPPPQLPAPIAPQAPQAQTSSYQAPTPVPQFQGNSGHVSQRPGIGPGLTNTAAGLGAQVGGHMVANHLISQGASNPSWVNGAAGMGAGIGISMAGNALANKTRVNEEMPTYGGRHADLLDAFGRRYEGTGGGINSGAIRGATMGANPALAAATGGISVGAGALGGAIAAAATKNAPSAFTDFSAADAYNAIGSGYQKYLGRQGSNDEIMQHMINQGYKPNGGDRWVGEHGLNSVLDAIADSPEAQARLGQSPSNSNPQGQTATAQSPVGTQSAPPQVATSPGQSFSSYTNSQSNSSAPYQQPPLGDVGPTTTFPGSNIPVPLTNAQNEATLAALPKDRLQWSGSSSALPPNSEGPGGFTGKLDQPGYGAESASTGSASSQGLGQYASSLEGYDSGKLNDPNKHDPKYDIGRIESHYDPHKGITPEMLAELNKLGYGTFSGQGDKLHVDGGSPEFEGVSDFDVARDFGNGGWQWQPEGGSSSQGSSSPTLGGSPQQFNPSAIPQGMGNNYSDAIIQYLLKGMGLDRAAYNTVG